MSEGIGPQDEMDIEARQDELLRRLDELNHRVELALVSLLGERSTPHLVTALGARGRQKVSRAA